MRSSSDALVTHGEGRPAGSGGPAGGRGADRGVAAAKRRSHLGDSLVILAKQIGFGLALIGTWQLVVWAGLVSEFVLPSPWDTLMALGRAAENILTGGFLFDAFVITTTEVVAGLAVATVAGLILGVIVGDTRFGADVVMPYVVAVNSMPKIAFAPVFVAWLGFGLSPKILLAAFIAFFPVVVNTAAGVAAHSENEAYLFSSMRASRLQTLVKLKLPTALPYIFAGVKTAAVLCVIGAIVAEFMGGNGQGVGELIRLRSGELRMDDVFALILLLSLVGTAIYGAITLLERRVVHWQGR